MKTIGFCIGMVLLAVSSMAQTSKDLERIHRSSPFGPLGISDRAGGTHDKSNIGLFFENRGKLYPHEAAQGPSGNFPITATNPMHEYIYRINPLVGIPGNVIQGRYTTDEEWEAVGGYNNHDSARIAFSDKPLWWPSSGWPVKDNHGNSIVVSDQDSYCVYADSNNSKRVLGIQINQTGYAFSLKPIQDMIVYKFDIVNKSPHDYDSLYFGMYIDIDVGEGGGGHNEYADDKLDFDRERNLVYFYDSKGYSLDWGTATGYFGMMMLKTPMVNGAEPGITDFHYNIYNNDLDRDTVQYGIISSAASLYSSALGPRYFHLGANAPNLHYDDPATIPPTGLDLVSNIGSGPYTLRSGDTLTMVTAIVAGNTRAEILGVADRAQNLVNASYERPHPPRPTPSVRVVAGDRRVNISWDNLAEYSRDPVTGHVFAGYRLYKSIDLGQHWDQIDRNQFPNTGPDPVPLAVFDKIDTIPPNNGLQYGYVDTSVTNGFEYWYSVTAYDNGDSLLPSLEDSRGNDASAPNLGIAIPRSSAIGRTPVSSTTVQQTGTGSSNVQFSVRPNDVPEAGDRRYDMTFGPVVSLEQGDTRTIVTVTVDSVSESTSHTYSFAFLSATTYRLRDLTRGTVLVAAGNYRSDTTYIVSGLHIVMRDTASTAGFRPQPGDSIVIGLGMAISSNGAVVLPLQTARYNTNYATSNGVMLSFEPIDPIQSIGQTSGSAPVTVRATVTNTDLIVDNVYRLRFDGLFADSGRVFYARVSVTNNVDTTVVRLDSLRSGSVVSLSGFSLNVVFDPTTSAGTTVEVRTVKVRPLTYVDAFSFSTVGARIDQGAIAAQLGRVKVVPNPYLVSSQYEREYGSLRREPIRQLKFINLPPKCTIYVFSIAGDKVQTIEHNSSDGTETWDMRGAGGRVIAPGVYLYLVKTDVGEKLDRFAVIK